MALEEVDCVGDHGFMLRPVVDVEVSYAGVVRSPPLGARLAASTAGWGWTTSSSAARDPSSPELTARQPRQTRIGGQPLSNEATSEVPTGRTVLAVIGS